MNAAEIMVRMGELAASATPGQVLVSIGLGSCIGVALLDRRRGVAGLAHVMLPDSRCGSGELPGKFADVAVPGLVERVLALGAARWTLEAVLVGGAQMFRAPHGDATRLDIGARNEIAARAALKQARIAVRAHATAGSKGRTVRVDVARGLVTAKEAGGSEQALLGPPSRGAGSMSPTVNQWPCSRAPSRASRTRGARRDPSSSLRRPSVWPV